MDDDQLKKIMQEMETPAPQRNARQSAVNAALYEFQEHHNKKSKKFQGIAILSRLMGNTNSKNRRTTMEQKTRKNFMYGGMATAMAVILMTGVSYNQLQERNIVDLPSQQESIIRSDKTQSDKVVIAQLQAAPEPETRALPKRDGAISKTVRPVPQDQAGATQYANEVKQNRTRELSAISGDSVPKRESFAPSPAQNRMMMAESDSLGRAAASPPVSSSVFLDDEAPQYYKDEGRDKFEDFEVNAIKLVSENPVSTFSVDVDTASYSFMRRQINNGVLPQKDAIRVEELINYFDYNYAVPDDKAQPFKPSVTVTDSPWSAGNKLVHIGVKGYEIQGERPNSNLVFLLDTSGSMNAPDKLPLVKNSLKMMLDNMDENDTVSIVVYAGSAGTVLEPTKASEKNKIIAALDRLNAGGSTAGAAGIKLAYQMAEQNFDEDAVNRVILATDGDFNVGISNHEELQGFVERKRDTGIFLSVLGFGQGNYNDHMMQVLAQNGNGVAAYIDNLNEARKVLVEEASGTLFTIAKDVKIQVEFNPQAVSEYRLVGYETRALNREDFNNDKVDAGDIGAGHTVTAIYEITPAGQTSSVDPLRYADEVADEEIVQNDFNGEYAFLKMRYKLPHENTSNLLTTPITIDHEAAFENIECGANEDCVQSASGDVRFAISVAAFGQILKGGKYTSDYNYDDVIALAKSARGDDEFGYRTEFINLVRLAKSAQN